MFCVFVILSNSNSMFQKTFIMKLQNQTFAVALLSVVLLSSCTKDKCVQEHSYSVFEPVYMEYAELRSSVASTDVQPLTNPGKIFIIGDYLFINEVDKGIHIVDNTNPSSPNFVSFINIPGNIDIAVREHVLYADSYIDLLAIDVSDPTNVSVTKRIQSVFPQRGESFMMANIDNSLGAVTGWNEEIVTEEIEVDCSGGGGWWGGFMEGDAVALNSSGGGTNFSGTQSGGTPRNATPGQGGSMARFAMYANYLYAVDHSVMHLFDISSWTDPVKWNEVQIGWNIETIFTYDQKLFIGSQQGMYIYDNTDPAAPQYEGNYWHFTSCDPVVVEGNYAYITLRSGTWCNLGENQLDVVNISDPSNPWQVQAYDMTNPHGLGIDDGTLFICDGSDGLKIYDASNPSSIDQNLLYHYTNITASDVIPYDGLLIMTSAEGIYQYDYNDLSNVSLLSHIPIN